MTHEPHDRLELAPTETAPSHRDLTRVVDRGPVGFVITDNAGVITWINETLVGWLGFEREQLIGRSTFQALLSPGGRIYYDTHVRPLLHMEHTASEIALELVCVDGRRLPVLTNASLETDEHTGEVTIETFVIDASRRREYEIELRRERETAERSEARLQVLYDVVSGLAEAESVSDIVDVVTGRANRSITGARCTIWLLDANERSAARVGTIPDLEIDLPTAVAFADGGPALDQLASGHVVVVTDRLLSENMYPVINQWMADTGLRSAAIAPILASGRLFGAISYGFAEPHTFDDAELRAAIALAEQTEQGLSRARVLEAERRNKQHLESLLEFTTVLSAALTRGEVIDAIVDRGQQLLGAVGTRVALVDESGTAVTFVSSRTSGGQPGIHLPLDRRSIACESIRTNRPVIVRSRQELEERFPESPVLDHPSIGRVMSMPLRCGDEVLGAWVLVDSGSDRTDTIDVTMFELFAEQAGQAAQRAATHEAEALARTQAEIRNRISASLNAASTTSDVGRAITVQGGEAFDADALAFFVVDPNNPASMQLESQSGLDDSVIAATSAMHIDDHLAGLLSGPPTPRYAVGASEFDPLLDVIFGTGRRGPTAVIPLSVAGHLLGLIVIGFHRPDALSPSERLALSGLAGEANVALVRARRFDVDRDVATTLQRSLLPSIGSVGDDWSVSTSYKPWSELLEVGGDFFDITPFDDGRLVLVVGDVVGHGLSAAAAMGLLRSAAKMITLVSASPADVIEGLHAFARVTPAVVCSTVCCIEVRPDGTGRYSAAGHPFPVLRHSDGRTDLLDGGRSPLLGIGVATPSNAEFVIEVGSSVVVYTDGLIERKLELIDVGLDRLRQYLGGGFDASDELSADRIVRALLDGQQHDDDVVVVCLTRATAEHAPISQTR